MGKFIVQSAAAAAMKGDRLMSSREDNRRLAEAYNEAMGIGDTNLHDELTDDPRRLRPQLRRLPGPDMRPLRSLRRWIHGG